MQLKLVGKWAANFFVQRNKRVKVISKKKEIKEIKTQFFNF